MQPSAQPPLTRLNEPMQIGNVHVRNRAFLAPMSGVTDLPFRQIAWRAGAGMVTSEMVASEALVEGDEEMRLKVCGAGEPLHVVQLAGREEKWMHLGAKMAVEAGAAIIDINMGCPSKRVINGYSGSALMRDLDHALRLIEATVKAVEVPVTLKMRLGWDHNTINAPQLAARARDAGIQMITVHGRTRCQFYKGAADWLAVRDVKSVVDIPVVINGDVTSGSSTADALQESGADAVMIGRGAYGAPWLAGRIANENTHLQFDLESYYALIAGHYQSMLEFYGLKSGMKQARKHLGWYLDRIQCDQKPSYLRRTVMTCDDPVLVLATVREILNEQFGNSAQPELAA